MPRSIAVVNNMQELKVFQMSRERGYLNAINRDREMHVGFTA